MAAIGLFFAILPLLPARPRADGDQDAPPQDFHATEELLDDRRPAPSSAVPS